MQKKLIALAIAGLVSAPAFAQSNVTIYGVADAYMGFGSHGKNDLSAVQSGGLSGSRLGFRGTEDLGNGLKGVFTLEQGFDISKGTGLGDASRQAFVGLAGGFGAVTLGRQYAPGYDFQYDALVSSAISPQAILSGAAIGDSIDGTGIVSALTINPGSSARWDNSVAYNGSFAGLKVRAIYAMGNNETNTYKNGTLTAPQEDLVRTSKAGDDDRMGLGVEYANGPLKVGAVYHYLKSATNSATLLKGSADEEKLGLDDQKEWLIGGSYNFGVLTLAGSYQQADNVAYIKDLDADLWQLGVIVPVGAAGNVHVGYGEVKYEEPGEADAKSKSWTLAYTHALSKRTTAYVGYNETKNDDGLGLGPVPSGSVKNVVQGPDVTRYSLTSTEMGEKSKLFVVGVRHTF